MAVEDELAVAIMNKLLEFAKDELVDIYIGRYCDALIKDMDDDTSWKDIYKEWKKFGLTPLKGNNILDDCLLK